ncbi:hypothetical protein ACFVAE_00610 [Microbacterium sp. NPDC057659]|uniref:hypothetical protein n=1 Tax=Microbacterium sp. NPDC057659 TaxID=3346198 RepID=UPI00366F508B
MPKQKSALSRRTVLKGAAWSLPVIAVATAVPAHAASGEPTVIGGFHESSGFISSQTINASSMWVDCNGETNSNEYTGLPFTITVTVSYTGTPDFSLANSTLFGTDAVWSASTSSSTVVLTSVQTFVGCGGGQFLKGWNLLYNAGTAQPAANTISITATAVSADGRFEIEGLINDAQPGGAGPWVGPSA